MLLHKDAYFIPFSVQYQHGEGGLFASGTTEPNLSDAARRYLLDIGLAENEPEYGDALWLHALAISYAPAYVRDNAGGIAADWPRIPLPASADRLRDSAELGGRLAALLDPLEPLPNGLPTVVGLLRREDGLGAQPDRGDLAVTVQWGVVHKSGAVMPGSGKLRRRVFTDSEALSLGGDTTALGQACDVYLNTETFWSCVPSAAWEYKIGGFQPLKKWLSYREHGAGHSSLLGRGLTITEAREFTALVQRVTGVILLMAELDANYLATITATHTWPAP